MARGVRTSWLGPTALVGVAIAAIANLDARATQGSDDLLKTEIERWTAFLSENTSNDPMWAQVKEASQPPLAKASEAIRDGRRLLALARLVEARPNLAASAYLRDYASDQRKDGAAFEREWARIGSVLRDDMRPPSPAALDGVRPAALRALGEVALPQVRAFYQASLEYGRSTMPEFGLFYLGAAQAQRDFARLSRFLSEPSMLRAPPVRVLDGELEALEGEILAAYRPPASVDRHREFIVASATVKEARELNAAGLHYGSLLRYLQARLRFAPLRPAPVLLDTATLAARMHDTGQSLSAAGIDHSLGRLFLEQAEADIAASPSGERPMTATTIVTDVLPHYFSALEAAKPLPPKAEPRVTVTLVRWPYT